MRKKHANAQIKIIKKNIVFSVFTLSERISFIKSQRRTICRNSITNERMTKKKRRIVCPSTNFGFELVGDNGEYSSTIFAIVVIEDMKSLKLIFSLYVNENVSIQ